MLKKVNSVHNISVHLPVTGRILCFLLMNMGVFFVSNTRAQVIENRVVLGLTGGLSYGTLKCNDVEDSTFNFKPAVTTIGGVSIEIPIPKLEERGTFYNELTVSHFDASSSVHFPDTLGGQAGYLDVKQRFAPNLVTLSTMFRYCFTNGKFKYYAGAGIYNSFVISPTNTRIEEHLDNGNLSTETTEAVPKHSTHGLMLLVSTGFTYKYLGLEFRFDPGRNYTKKVDYSVYNSNFSVMLHLRFNP